jgi:DMSO/TMAO reductase YedYZ heme-binding membrane subunit
LGVTFTWLLSRSAGIVAWALVVASCTWGVLLATRALARRGVRKPSPAWIFSIHRFLGALTIVFTAIHVLAILFDPFVTFSVVDVLVPFSSTWEPLAIAIGIVAMYLLVAIEVTSLLRDRMPVRVWRSIHLLAYALLALTTFHALLAGTDVKALVPTAVGVVIGCVMVFACGLAWGVRRNGRPRAPKAPTSPRPPRQPRMPRLPQVTVVPPRRRARPMAHTGDRS